MREPKRALWKASGQTQCPQEILKEPSGIHRIFGGGRGRGRSLQSPREALIKPSRSPKEALKDSSGIPQKYLRNPLRIPWESFRKPSGSPQEALRKPLGSPQEALRKPSLLYHLEPLQKWVHKIEKCNGRSNFDPLCSYSSRRA